MRMRMRNCSLAMSSEVALIVEIATSVAYGSFRLFWLVSVEIFDVSSILLTMEI